MPGALADVMQPCPPCVHSGLSSSHLGDVFEKSGAERVLVVGDDGRLIGAISAATFQPCVCHQVCPTAGDLAGRFVLTASPTTPIEAAYRAFRTGPDRFVAVLEDGRPVGSLRPSDLFAWIRQTQGEHALQAPHFLRVRVSRSTSVRPAG